MAYLIGLGHDEPLEDLDPFVPQPSSVGYQFGRRSYAASGAILDELPHVELNYTSLGWNVIRYQALLAQCGLTVAKTALVTVQVQDENYEWVIKNGTIVKPLVGTDGARNFVFLRGFTFLVHSLRDTA